MGHVAHAQWEEPRGKVMSKKRSASSREVAGPSSSDPDEGFSIVVRHLVIPSMELCVHDLVGMKWSVQSLYPYIARHSN